MSNIVEVAAQIDINYARLILNNCLGYPVYRFMSCPIGTVSKRSRLEVRLKDRLQYELERLSMLKIVETARKPQFPRAVPIPSGGMVTILFALVSLLSFRVRSRASLELELV